MSTERVVGVGAGAAGFDPAYERGGTGSGSELPTTHKAAMDSLLTHNFQTFENVSVVAA